MTTFTKLYQTNFSHYIPELTGWHVGQSSKCQLKMKVTRITNVLLYLRTFSVDVTFIGFK